LRARSEGKAKKYAEELSIKNFNTSNSYTEPSRGMAKLELLFIEKPMRFLLKKATRLLMIGRRMLFIP
jgi:hypothetical protein